ncbi:hypothetical protein FOA43_001437 [Brettanomyces nanus]|uniref:non-specific serine/threonine protein kinase n=1 Tax=Eeniella nana TaxID=13502 RepID=A0A875S1A5_EENNA|nr:uncharacterized protein FOA43_001437 [Brettanomyces nanus]QPG74115.1 hypothetical protein FOA43_001437 [Brettanomyces nanus]
MSHKPDPVIRHYRRLEVVGRGKFGTVYKGLDLNTKRLVAIKVLNLDTEEDEVRDVQKEIQFLSQLKSIPNVTHYYGSYLNGHNLWIIMDLCAGGSVRTLLKPGPLEEKYISIISRELLNALKFIHENGVIHRDIKAANILISKDGQVQLCDFGVAAQLTSTALKRTTMAGTPYWMAPEVITEGATYNVKADIWSYGITIYEMATGNPPYGDKDAMRALQMIAHHEPPRLEGRQYSGILKEFVALCLEEKPDLRPGASDLSRSKFVRAYKQVPSTVLKEVIGRYLLWRDKQSSRDSLYLEDEAEKVRKANETQSYDVKWDFDSLKSAEYIIENDIEVDDMTDNGTNSKTNGYHTPITYHTHNEVTYSPGQQRTLVPGGASTTTLGPAGVSDRPITPVTASSTLNPSNYSPGKLTTHSEPPKSLLKLFNDGDVGDDDRIINDHESSVADDGLLLIPSASSKVQKNISISAGPQEMAPLLEEREPAFIEIPTIEKLELDFQKQQQQQQQQPLPPTQSHHQRSRASTVTSLHPSPLQIATPAFIPRRSNSSTDFRLSNSPELAAIRHPTLSGTLGRRTPSPKKNAGDSAGVSDGTISADISLHGSPLRNPKSPPHMKPLDTNFTQPLLQPINTSKANASMPPELPSGSQTAPSLSNSDLHEQQQQSLARARSQKRLQMPTPVSYQGMDLQNVSQQLAVRSSSPDKLNQFGVNINLASNLPLVMTPVTEREDCEMQIHEQQPEIIHSISSPSPGTTFFHPQHSHAIYGIEDGSDLSPQSQLRKHSVSSSLSAQLNNANQENATAPSEVNHHRYHNSGHRLATQPNVSSNQMIVKLAELHVTENFDSLIPGALIGEPAIDAHGNEENSISESVVENGNFIGFNEDREAMALEVIEVFGKIRQVLDVAVGQIS